jgi:hypothetical protein
MTRQTVTLLATQMDEAQDSVRRWVDGLSDEEFFWEPVSGCGVRSTTWRTTILQICDSPIGESNGRPGASFGP